LGIDLSQIQIQIALKDEDKKLIQESLENMSNDVKKYWTRTHILMVLIAVGSLLTQVI
jgi:3-methyladenine DNA glycosylase AlkC